jgi:predicted phage baseplate assembly protein
VSAWWGREATAGDVPTLAGDGTPILHAGDRRTVAADVRGRIRAYTPSWSRRGEDAGEALVRLFGEQAEALLGRLNRWPEKALVEFLVTAGIAQRPAKPATVMVAFTIAPSAGQSALVPAGLQIGAQPAGGGDLVTFETDRDLVAAPVTIAALLVEAGGDFTPVPSNPPPPTFLPFGVEAETGRALWIGLAGDAPLGPKLALGFGVWAPPGAPPPVAAGGVVDLPVPPGPLLQWHLLDGATLQPLEALFDETDGLGHTGVIELALPRVWRSGTPPGSGAPRLRWLRLGVAAGRYGAPPRLQSLLLNCVPATAAVTIRDEVLEPIDPDGRSYRLARRPVLPRTVILAVDEGADLGGLGGGGEAEGAIDSGVAWREVDDLSQFGPDDRVFAVDGALGLVYTGDGVHGMAVPPGFRNVVARRYRAGGGSAGAVGAEAVTTLIGAAPFVTAVTNARPASGGDDVELPAAAIRRGPQEVRARGRAVTLADHELMALGTPGADVRRAHALSGHPAYPAVRMTGVVGVVVVPADRGEGPPTPDTQLLGAVARHLARTVAPLGVEVVAAAPEYHRVRVQAQVLLDAAADVGPTVERILATLDRYLHPLTGGEDGQGWPFGGAVRHADLLRQIGAVAGVRGAPRLDLVVDGELAAECADVTIPPHSLVWPESHQVVPVSAGDDA